NDVRVLSIDPDPGAVIALAVRDARFIASHVLPRRALIVGPRETRSALKRRADHEDALAAGVHRDRDADATGVGRESGDLGPCLTLIDRFVEPGAIRSLRRTATKSPTGSFGSCEHHVRHVERVLDIARAVCVFRSQRVLPGLATVGRSIDA